MSAGSKRLPSRQVGHEGDEAGIDPPAAGDGGRAVARRAAGVERQADVEPAGGMIGDDVAAGLRRLGIGEMPPALDREGGGLVDHPRARRLAGLKADRGEAVGAGVGIGLGRIDDAGGAEQELRSGDDADHHRDVLGKLDADLDVGDLLAGGADADLRAVVAGGIERDQEAAVVAAGLGEQPGVAGGRRLAVAPERGGGLEPALEVVLAARDVELDGVVQRVDDREGVPVVARAPEVDAEQAEGVGRRRAEQRRAERQADQYASMRRGLHDPVCLPLFVNKTLTYSRRAASEAVPSVGNFPPKRAARPRFTPTVYAPGLRPRFLRLGAAEGWTPARAID